MAAYPAIEQLVPHRGSMLLLDRIISHHAGSLMAQATVRPDAWYLDAAGAMPAWIGIELMAQAAAAFAGLEASALGLAPPRGMLVGCRAYRADSPSLSGVLEVKASRSAADENGFSLFDCSVGGQVTGTIQVLTR